MDEWFPDKEWLLGKAAVQGSVAGLTGWNLVKKCVEYWFCWIKNVYSQRRISVSGLQWQGTRCLAGVQEKTVGEMMIFDGKLRHW